MLTAVPITKREADAFIRAHHRHHKPVLMDIFRVAASDGERVVGVAQVEHPVARALTDGVTVEVCRLCALLGGGQCLFVSLFALRQDRPRDGVPAHHNYIYESEPGTSLLASGWQKEAVTKGHSWSHTSRPRQNELPIVDKQRWGRWL